MPDNKGILNAIGRILQKYELGKTKKKKGIAAVTGGLQSNIGRTDVMQKIASRDPYLNSLLLSGKLDERTDEGALMGLRAKYPGI